MADYTTHHYDSHMETNMQTNTPTDVVAGPRPCDWDPFNGGGLEAAAELIDRSDDLRAEFPPEQVGKLDRGRGVVLDYVGHGAVTARLLDVDPCWFWEPLALGHDSLPLFEVDERGNRVGLWIKLHVLGLWRVGYGSCPSNQFDAEKVLIGDAIRNAAMRFGVALDLWVRGHDPEDQPGLHKREQPRRDEDSAGYDGYEGPLPSKRRKSKPVPDAEQRDDLLAHMEEAEAKIAEHPKAQEYLDSQLSRAKLDSLDLATAPLGKLRTMRSIYEGAAAMVDKEAQS